MGVLNGWKGTFNGRKFYIFFCLETAAKKIRALKKRTKENGLEGYKTCSFMPYSY